MLIICKSEFAFGLYFGDECLILLKLPILIEPDLFYNCVVDDNPTFPYNHKRADSFVSYGSMPSI
jgi:hypothetical protein